MSEISLHDGYERRIATLEAKIAEPHERLAALEANQRAVNEALLNNILNDLGEWERSKYEKATIAALREALK